MNDILITHFEAPQDYQRIYEKMRNYTLHRDANSPDYLWFLEHHPVFTQGQAGKPEHVLNPGDIPIIQSDRGGQVTYHGPGQLMVYTLFDLKRRQLGIKSFVQLLENSIIALLKSYGIAAHTQCGAPGVYIDNAKICSLGLRIRHFRAYHGLALNVKMDLSPFSRINPCGFKKLAMTQISDFVPNITIKKAAHDLAQILMQHQVPAMGECHER
ncbi:MAG: lipoyl(octanoyl) transferase LipB [Candidatus Berkiella sp.]